MSESVKQLRLEPIQKRAAIQLLTTGHHLGAGSITFSLALGVFWNGRLEGVLTFGCPIVNNATLAFGLRQREVWELRKMWLSDRLPRMSEGRALSVAARLIRAKYPQIRMLITYCDGAEKAAAYIGSGWVRHSITRHIFAFRQKDGTEITMRNANRKGIRAELMQTAEPIRVERAKLVLCLDPSLKVRTKGKCGGSRENAATRFQRGEGGANPTPPLHSDRQRENRPPLLGGSASDALPMGVSTSKPST